MAWFTKVPAGQEIVINGAIVSFEKGTKVCIHNTAEIEVRKRDGSKLFHRTIQEHQADEGKNA